MINTLTRLTDYDIVNNVVEDHANYYNISPSFYFNYTLAPYMLKDMGRFHNEAFKFSFNSPDVSNFKFQVLFGCNSSGDGYAVSIENSIMKLVTVSTFVETAVLSERGLSRSMNFANNTYYSFKLVIANAKLQIYLNDNLFMEYNSFSPIANYYGYHLNGSTANVYISDTTYYDDQVIWGNVNLNGENNEDGFSLLFNQISIDLHSYSPCDTSGNWIIFIDDDPIQQNRFILIGAISSKEYLQPKGISSITL